MSKCKSEYGDKCAVYSVGDQVVVGFSKRKLAAAIEAHDRRNKKIVTASTSSTSFGTTPTYCKMPDGRVYLRAPGSHCAYNKEITKAEYDRLKIKLKEVKDLLDEGLITEEEAAAKRAKLLEDF